MAAVMTYNSLVADMITYAERVTDDDYIAQIPRLIMLAENRIATDLKTEGVQMVVTGILTTSNPTLAKPAFWRDTISFQITRANGKRFNVYPRFYEYCQQVYPDRAVLGEPRYYADYNFDNFFIAPTPAAPLAFELTYHARLDPLDPAHQTNWSTVNAPQLLFYAAMLEAQVYLKNQDNVGLYGNLYRDMLNGLDKEDHGRSNDRTTVPS